MHSEGCRNHKHMDGRGIKGFVFHAKYGSGTKNRDISSSFSIQIYGFFPVRKIAISSSFFSKLDKLILVLQPLFEPDRSVPLAKDINEVLKIM